MFLAFALRKTDTAGLLNADSYLSIPLRWHSLRNNDLNLHSPVNSNIVAQALARLSWLVDQSRTPS